MKETWVEKWGRKTMVMGGLVVLGEFQFTFFATAWWLFVIPGVMALGWIVLGCAVGVHTLRTWTP